MFEIKEDRKELMSQIKDEVLDLKNSPLYKFRIENNSFPVVGEGSHFAKIMFIGEAPGRNEAKTGRPFCGRAGEVLNQLLDSVSIKREDIYITNIVKDRPPQNRDPLLEEIKIYSPFLDRQIEIIKPQIIATLGRYAMSYIMQKFHPLFNEPISKAHGKIYEAKTTYGDIKITPLYHPAVAVYNSNTLGTLKNDFNVLSNLQIR